MSLKNRSLFIGVVVLSVLLIASLIIALPTIYHTAWTNIYLRDLAGRAEYSVDTLPWFNRINHMTQHEVPYGLDDASGKIGVSVFQATLSKKQAERAKALFEDPDSTVLSDLDDVKALMDASPGSGYAEKLLPRPGYSEMAAGPDAFIVDALRTEHSLVIQQSAHVVFFDDYRACTIVIYEPHPY